MDTNETVIELKRDKECKGSVRFATDNPDAAITNVYLSRTHPASKCQKIAVTVAAGE